MDQEHRRADGKQKGAKVRPGSKKSQSVQSSIPSNGSRSDIPRNQILEHMFEGQGVRMLSKDGQTWFVAADVCAILGTTHPHRAVARLRDFEKGVTNVATLGGDQSVNIINESGVYALCFGSRKPKALAFRCWVTSVLLPTLRETGSFNLHDAGAKTLTLSIPDEPTRLIVIAMPGDPIHVRRTRPEAILDELTAIDCAIIAHAVKTIELWWHATEQMRSVGLDPAGGFAQEQLESAIRDATFLADRFLKLSRKDVAAG